MKSLRITLAFAAALLAAPAFAQDDGAAPAAPQANKPMQPNEVKEFGDWTVRCYPVTSPSPCEMIELRVAKKTGQRILGFGRGRGTCLPGDVRDPVGQFDRRRATFVVVRPAPDNQIWIVILHGRCPIYRTLSLI